MKNVIVIFFLFFVSSCSDGEEVREKRRMKAAISILYKKSLLESDRKNVEISDDIIRGSYSNMTAPIMKGVEIDIVNSETEVWVVKSKFGFCSVDKAGEVTFLRSPPVDWASDLSL